MISSRSLPEAGVGPTESKQPARRRRFTVYGRRMLAAMLCWTALQSAAAHLEDGRARAAVHSQSLPR